MRKGYTLTEAQEAMGELYFVEQRHPDWVVFTFAGVPLGKSPRKVEFYKTRHRAERAANELNSGVRADHPKSSQWIARA